MPRMVESSSAELRRIALQAPPGEGLRVDLPRVAPIAGAERAASLDALRGVALFGVLMVNLVTEFRVSLFEQFLPRAPSDAGSVVDRAVASFVSVGLQSKAFCIFSLLFGAGLAKR